MFYDDEWRICTKQSKTKRILPGRRHIIFVECSGRVRLPILWTWSFCDWFSFYSCCLQWWILNPSLGQRSSSTFSLSVHQQEINQCLQIKHWRELEFDAVEFYSTLQLNKIRVIWVQLTSLFCAMPYIQLGIFTWDFLIWCGECSPQRVLCSELCSGHHVASSMWPQTPTFPPILKPPNLNVQYPYISFNI